MAVCYSLFEDKLYTDGSMLSKAADVHGVLSVSNCSAQDS